MGDADDDNCTNLLPWFTSTQPLPSELILRRQDNNPNVSYHPENLMYRHKGTQESTPTTNYSPPHPSQVFISTHLS